jgi:hypothetical protein
MTCTGDGGYTGLTIMIRRHSEIILRLLNVVFGEAESL